MAQKDVVRREENQAQGTEQSQDKGCPLSPREQNTEGDTGNRRPLSARFQGCEILSSAWGPPRAVRGTWCPPGPGDVSQPIRSGHLGQRFPAHDLTEQQGSVLSSDRAHGRTNGHFLLHLVHV